MAEARAFVAAAVPVGEAIDRGLANPECAAGAVGGGTPAPDAIGAAEEVAEGAPGRTLTGGRFTCGRVLSAPVGVGKELSAEPAGITGLAAAVSIGHVDRLPCAPGGPMI